MAVQITQLGLEVPNRSATSEAQFTVIGIEVPNQGPSDMMLTATGVEVLWWLDPSYVPPGASDGTQFILPNVF